MAAIVSSVKSIDMMQNPYAVIPAVITEVIEESPLIRTLRLKPERPLPFKTGQFIELTIPGIGEGPPSV